MADNGKKEAKRKSAKSGRGQRSGAMEPENQDGPAQEESEPDLGAGVVTMTFDYGTQTIRVVHDNLKLSAFVSCKDALVSYVDRVVDQAREDVIRAQIMAEIQKGREKDVDAAGPPSPESLPEQSMEKEEVQSA